MSDSALLFSPGRLRLDVDHILEPIHGLTLSLGMPLQYIFVDLATVRSRPKDYRP
jgi:hypothetical protein